MRLWFDHSSEVTLHEQIVTQIRLGILSGELGPGTKLPSIRELARRFHIHANTVSSAYSQLRREHWVVNRKGSGMYACDVAARTEAGAQHPSSRLVLSGIEELLRSAESFGVSRSELRSLFLRAVDREPPHSFLLIEPDQELRRIVRSELEAALGVRVATFDLPLSEIENNLTPLAEGVIALVLPSKAASVRTALPRPALVVTLQINSVAGALVKNLPTSREGLIGVASRWPSFLEFARTMLISAGYPSEALILRDSGQAQWAEGLDLTVALICDSLTARQAPVHTLVLTFALIAEESLAHLGSLVKSEERIGQSSLPKDE